MSTESLIQFKAIANFVKELASTFSNKQRSLKLYSHLLNKTALSHEGAIAKNVQIFREFCIQNRDAILNRDRSLLRSDSISYSKNAHFSLTPIFEAADADTVDVIWKHLIYISSLVDPSAQAAELIKKFKGSGKEGNFLADIMNKMNEHMDSSNAGANPMEAVSSMMQSGVFNDLISSMNGDLQSGQLDIGKLMVSVQGLLGSITSGLPPGAAGEVSGGGGAAGIESLMAGMPPELMGSLSAMIGSMGGAGGGVGGGFIDAAILPPSSTRAPILEEIDDGDIAIDDIDTTAAAAPFPDLEELDEHDVV
jgi:hypothetical protein